MVPDDSKISTIMAEQICEKLENIRSIIKNRRYNQDFKIKRLELKKASKRLSSNCNIPTKWWKCKY